MRSAMKTITFKSNSENKIGMLIKMAKEIGVETYSVHELTDEEMALPGTYPSDEQLEQWLVKDDGEKYEINDAFAQVKTELSKARKRKK